MTLTVGLAPGQHTPTMPEDPPKTWLTYHLAHPGPDRAIPADPNCAIFHNGRYHLHYIYQNEGHSFAHVSSTDMVHWKWHPTMLTPPKTGHGMFSGTAFLTKEGKPAIIHHGKGSSRNQVAFALDDNLDDRKDTFDALMKGKIQPGIQSLPRELSLPEDGVLRIKPLRELEQLRFDRKQEAGIAVESDATHTLKDIAGDTMELGITFAAPLPEQFGVNLMCDEDGNGGFTIASGKASRTLTVGYVDPPFELKEGEDLTLRVFIDKSMIEVFANDRQAAVAWHEYEPENLRVSLFGKGGPLTVDKVEAWNMKSIYSGE